MLENFCNRVRITWKPQLIAIYDTPNSDVKASACNAGDPGSIPGLGRSPGEGNGNPLQYSCLENPVEREAWWATVHGVAKSWTWLSDFTFTFCTLTMCPWANNLSETHFVHWPKMGIQPSSACKMTTHSGCFINTIPHTQPLLPLCFLTADLIYLETFQNS